MEIIRCECGHYKMLDDELCPVCKADYSRGAGYEVLDDQELAHKRWKSLGGEKAFNSYMESMKEPKFMVCPKCNFKMLISETTCPKCGIDVFYVPGKKIKKSFLDRVLDFSMVYCKALIIIILASLVIGAIIFAAAILQLA